jgi:hypothetical protein
MASVVIRGTYTALTILSSDVKATVMPVQVGARYGLRDGVWSNLSTQCPRGRCDALRGEQGTLASRLGIDQPALSADQEGFMALQEVASHGDKRLGAVGVHLMCRIVHQDEVAVG